MWHPICFPLTSHLWKGIYSKRYEFPLLKTPLQKGDKTIWRSYLHWKCIHSTQTDGYWNSEWIILLIHDIYFTVVAGWWHIVFTSSLREKMPLEKNKLKAATRINEQKPKRQKRRRKERINEKKKQKKQQPKNPPKNNKTKRRHAFVFLSVFFFLFCLVFACHKPATIFYWKVCTLASPLLAKNSKLVSTIRRKILIWILFLFLTTAFWMIKILLLS